MCSLNCSSFFYPTVFVLDLARNGELQSRISRMGSLSTTCSRYYTAQLVDALDYMHLKGVIHRFVPLFLLSAILQPNGSASPPNPHSDLKPENLLLDDKFRIKITDFGTGKILGPGGRSLLLPDKGSLSLTSPDIIQLTVQRRLWEQLNMLPQNFSRTVRLARGG